MTTALEIGLAAASGLLGSGHCIGMCGGLAARMSFAARSFRGVVIRQLLWSSGRIVTYTFLGICAAAFGAGIMRGRSNAAMLQAGLAMIAGLVLIVQGLLSTGWIRLRLPFGFSSGCPVTSVWSKFLKGGSALGAFVAGLATGFLPCGLVLSFLGLAASTGNPLSGAALMFGFGLGTIPALLVTGAGFSLMSVGRRQRLLKVAAVCVVATGALTVFRGASFASAAFSGSSTEACPFCAAK